ncbi:sugar-binding transcriptional regulator [Trueperella sp. LYQ143]|uniref:sugar-binding transcriptional regulator n=1 Tax=Trueperella sp. LYQ143 TaxID=3391059 RepID=UPI00398370EE
MGEDRSAAAYEAAVMHFVHGETMETIARRLRVSRSTVSRLIAQARSEGMVHIVVQQPHDQLGVLPRWLAQNFGVRAHIVPVPVQASYARRLTAVARETGKMISHLMEPHTVIAVTWGNTMAAVIDHLNARPVRGSVVVQLNGAANASTASVPFAGSLMEAFGRAFGSTVLHFSVPAFFDDAHTRRALWRERSIQAVRAVALNADIAVFGIGALTLEHPSLLYSGGYLLDEEIAQLKANGVVGDVCTVLLRRDGTWDDLEMNDRASGPRPDELQAIARRIGVVCGVEKAEATLAALRSGVMTDLVLDEDLAQRIYELVCGVHGGVHSGVHTAIPIGARADAEARAHAGGGYVGMRADVAARTHTGGYAGRDTGAQKGKP